MTNDAPTNRVAANIIPFFPAGDVNYRFALALAHSFTTLDLRHMLRALRSWQKFEPRNPAIAAAIQAVGKYLNDRAGKYLNDRAANKHDQRRCELSRQCRQEKLFSGVDDSLRDMQRDRRHWQQLEMDLERPT